MQSHPRISNCLGVLENLPQEFTFSTTSKSERSRIHTFLGHRSLANKATVRLHRCMAKHGRAHRHRSFYHEGLWPWCRITSKVPVQVEWAMALMYGKTQKHSRKWQNAWSTESHLLYLHPSPTIITGHNTMIHSCKKKMLWLHALWSAYKFVKQKTPEEQSLRLRYASLAPRASPAKFSFHDDGSTFYPCTWYLAKSGKEELFLFYSCNLFKGASYISFLQKSYNWTISPKRVKYVNISQRCGTTVPCVMSVPMRMHSSPWRHRWYIS